MVKLALVWGGIDGRRALRQGLRGFNGLGIARMAAGAAKAGAKGSGGSKGAKRASGQIRGAGKDGAKHGKGPAIVLKADRRSQPKKRKGSSHVNPMENQAIRDDLLSRLSDGESLRSICDDPEMPSTMSVMRYLGNEANAGFREDYARAREAQADAIFDEIIDIADDGRNDWMESRAPNGDFLGYKENGEAIRRSHERIEARKWLAGKLRPKKYGDIQKHLISGDPDGAPITMQVVTGVPRPPDNPMIDVTPEKSDE